MKIRILMLAIVSTLLIGTDNAVPQQAASVAITMTVAARHGLVLELYDYDGSLLARSDPTIPPAKVIVQSPDGRKAGVYVPDVYLASPAVIMVVIGGTPPKRLSIEVADEKARARGVSPIRQLSAIEFCTAGDLGVRPGICLCFPSDLNQAVVGNLAIFKLDETAEVWVRLPACRTDTVECTISAEAAGFGVFRVMAQTATDLRHLVVLPNPYVPGLAAGGSLKFMNLTPEASIKIYDIEGRLVSKMDPTDSGGSVFWYGNDTMGRALASGVYLYVITTPAGNQASGKITLIR